MKEAERKKLAKALTDAQPSREELAKSLAIARERLSEAGRITRPPKPFG